ncbi:transcriptional regulator [Streptomyces sp. B6B3]|uniref:transcriptional regulator n=1 Tax=Streptomyces sp. B6B3 TaxID=3153570 RepID=UPI00325D375A
MLPDTSTIRVGAFDPAAPQTSPYASASDAAGEPVAMSRTTARIVARWVRRAWPDADWTRSQVLHLATATLAPVASAEPEDR